MKTLVGDAEFTRTPEGVRIDRADERVDISDELLRQMGVDPDEDGVVVFEGVNRTVTYRLLWQHPDLRAWRARRVDAVTP